MAYLGRFVEGIVAVGEVSGGVVLKWAHVFNQLDDLKDSPEK